MKPSSASDDIPWLLAVTSPALIVFSDDILNVYSPPSFVFSCNSIVTPFIFSSDDIPASPLGATTLTLGILIVYVEDLALSPVPVLNSNVTSLPGFTNTGTFNVSPFAVRSFVQTLSFIVSSDKYCAISANAAFVCFIVTVVVVSVLKLRAVISPKWLTGTSIVVNTNCWPS